MAEYEHLRASREAETGGRPRADGPRPTPLSARIAREGAGGAPAGGPSTTRQSSSPAVPPHAVDAFRVVHEVAASVREAGVERGRLARLGDRLRGRRSG